MKKLKTNFSLKKMKEIKKLIDVKSIVTLLFTVLVCMLAFKKVITGEQVMMTYTTIIAFYFGTQSTKKKEVVSDENKSSD